MRASVTAGVLLGLLASGVAAQEAAAPTGHDRAAAELVEVLQLKETTAASVKMMSETMVAQNPMFAQIRDIFVEFFNEFMRWEELQPEYVRMYREAYTEAELRELIAFYRTPLGQKTVGLTPRLMQEGAEIGQTQIRPHLPELQRRIQARIGGGV